MDADKRVHPRLRSTLSIRLRPSPRDARPRTIGNISLGGLACHSDEPVAVGERVAVELTLAGQTLLLHGTVARCQAEGGRFELGLRFEESPAEAQARACRELVEIERYRHEVLVMEGRQLSSDDAAREWMGRAAEPGGCPA